MSTNHLDLFPTNFHACDNDMPKSSTCPTCNNFYNNIEDSVVKLNSNAHDVSFSSVHFSDIDSDTTNTSDMQFSCHGSILNTSFNSDLNDDTEFNDDLLSLLSENEFDLKNPSFDEPELDTVSLSSHVTSVINTKVRNHNCAVLLCNENARKQFDTLFFMNFPNKNQVLCDAWWTICGRKDKFDSSSKICSIHFDPNDFITINVRRDGKLYRQTILKNDKIVPTLYLSPHEYTKFSKKRKKNLKDSRVTKKLQGTKKCVIQRCKKTFLKDSRSTLFFKFPLENEVLLKKWLNKIGLPNWQPLETDRICSDHFESYYVMKYNNIYQLDKYAIPSIKPNNPFVIKSKDCNNKKYECSEYNFRNLEFSHLDDNVLLVNEKNKKNNEKEKNNLLDSLVNNTDKDKQIKCHNKISETVTTHSNSSESKLTGANVLNSSTNCDNSSLEYMNVLDDINNIEGIEELQFKFDNSGSLTKQYLESFEREIAEELKTNGNSRNNNNNLEYIYLDLLNNENVAGSQPANNTNVVNCTNLVQDWHVKSNNIDNNKLDKEINMTPESNKNDNENGHSYGNLNMLNGDDVGEFLLSRKCIPKISKNKSNHNNANMELKTKEHDVENISNVPTVNNLSSTTFSSNLTKKWHIESIDHTNCEVNPESIIYNQDLTECYGEMLPPYCNSDCQLICFYSIPGPQRREIYNEFQKLSNVTEQNCNIAKLIQLRMVKNGDTFDNFVLYSLMMNEKLVKVCRTFFKNTLGISEKRLDAILIPINYSWYSDRDTALKVNVPMHLKIVTDRSVIMTNFIKESSILLDKDFNLFESEDDTEVSLENVSMDEYEKAMLFVKDIPRVLSGCQIPIEMKKQYFETSVCLENMYEMYSENYIRNKTPPPFTKLQFKKIYNHCMKTLLKMV